MCVPRLSHRDVAPNLGATETSHDLGSRIPASFPPSELSISPSYNTPSTTALVLRDTPVPDGSPC